MQHALVIFRNAVGCTIYSYLHKILLSFCRLFFSSVAHPHHHETKNQLVLATRTEQPSNDCDEVSQCGKDC